MELTIFCMIWTRRVLDDATSSIVVGRVQYHMDHLLVTSVIYWVEWMRCHVERGYGNLTPCGSTLWVRVKSDKSDMPFITIVYSLMRRRLVENILLSVRKICAVWPNLCHNILLVFGLDILWHLAMSLLNVSLDCGVLISSTSYSGFDLNLVQLMAWAEDTNIGMTLRFFIVLWILCSLFSPNDESEQLETLGKEFELAGDIWWGEHIQSRVLRQQDALALWGQWSYLSILYIWRFVWWDVSVL